MKIHMARVTLAFVALSLIAGGCTGPDANPPPAGTVSVCENWSNDEYWRNVSEIQDLTGETSGARVTYWAHRCSITASDAGTLELTLTEYARDTKPNSKYQKHPEALPAIYEKYLSPEGLIAAWSTVAMDINRGSATGQSTKESKDLQAAIGRGLAEVTDPERKAHLGSKFVKDIAKIGASQIQLRIYSKPESHQDDDWKLLDAGSVVHGWSVVAPLLRFGEFHEDFLSPIAVKIIEFDQDHDGDWAAKGEKATTFDLYTSSGDNGMEAVLEALSRNEDAAKKVAEATGDERVEELLGG